MSTVFNLDALIHAALMLAHFYFDAERTRLRNEIETLKREREETLRRLDLIGHKRTRREMKEALEQMRAWSDKA